MVLRVVDVCVRALHFSLITPSCGDKVLYFLSLTASLYLSPTGASPVRARGVSKVARALGLGPPAGSRGRALAGFGTVVMDR